MSTLLKAAALTKALRARPSSTRVVPHHSTVATRLVPAFGVRTFRLNPNTSPQSPPAPPFPTSSPEAPAGEDVRADGSLANPFTTPHETETKFSRTTTASTTVVSEFPTRGMRNWEDDEMGEHLTYSASASAELDPHHPGFSDIAHLGSPTLSEEAVHADMLAEWADPLRDVKRGRKEMWGRRM
ncbi:hypothetical protein MNV49_003666 [Pseudohyphozyma bogoriensis]|nr:hypothetical protein MNV49_003666 [Pseudohyphozyma bogoriensis]